MSHALPKNLRTIVSSPLPGKVLNILAQEGEYVQEGQSVFIIESMKMIHELQVRKPGKLQEVRVKIGDVVVANNQLATIE
ncbi:methylmalonyl-CoA decarboxylase, gamma subunit [Candidatus Vecturithrix granuli]|uniref:Methylmalonyl-CoA decarboxylase, gamma subunit n=1 Tax=Vecturithrix granuli TaxID=1499967 RepID=A0A081C710_VECG1|nr:methylmalonyl-CoA decarboxylase, gamma subunit [Candidatus Vecturithrix granuli]